MIDWKVIAGYCVFCQGTKGLKASNEFGTEFFGYLGKGLQGGLVETAKILRDPSAVWNFFKAGQSSLGQIFFEQVHIAKVPFAEGHRVNKRKEILDIGRSSVANLELEVLGQKFGKAEMGGEPSQKGKTTFGGNELVCEVNFGFRWYNAQRAPPG